MMPIIRPLIMQCNPPTEYQIERETFAEMKVELRKRKRSDVVQRLRRALTFGMMNVTPKPRTSASSSAADG